MLSNGDILGGYRIISRLGAGATAVVYCGKHLLLGHQVAIKVLKAELAERADTAYRFLTEARAINEIGHPNIVEIHDFSKTEKQKQPLFYMVMEFLEGQPLRSYLKETGPLPVEEAFSIASQVASALSAVHATARIHRDLKSDNIFLVSGENSKIVKLLDFGTVKELQSDMPRVLETDPGLSLGTPAYMAPEQILQEGEVDHRTDIYALGVVLYEMLTGRLPFDGDSFGKLMIQVVKTAPPPLSKPNRELPRGVEALVLRCLEKDPEDRYQSADELMQAIDELRCEHCGQIHVQGGCSSGVLAEMLPLQVESAAGKPPSAGSAFGNGGAAAADLEMTSAEDAMLPSASDRRRVRLRWMLTLLGLLVLTAGALPLWRYLSPSPTPLAATSKRPADVPIAALKKIVGEVQHRPREQVEFSTAKKGMDLFHLDAIKTGARSYAQVSFKAGGKLEVQDWTTVLVEAPDPEEKLPVARVKKGTVYTVVQPGRALRVISPGGRESVVRAEGDRPMKLRMRKRGDGLELAVLDGKAKVGTAGKTALVGSGHFVDVGRRPMAPAKLPPYPELVSPVVDGTVTGSIVLRWRALGNAKKFHVQVNRSSLFVGNRIDTQTGETYLVLPPGTIKPERYIWRVSAINAAGREGEFGFARRFTLAASKALTYSAEDFTPRANIIVSVIKETARVPFRWPVMARKRTLVVTQGKRVVARRAARGRGVAVWLKPGDYYWKLVDRDGTPAFPPRRLILRRRTPPKVIPRVYWPKQKDR
jgi:tRNA A-37 threonylcarbamoyl transferase component Bud32